MRSPDLLSRLGLAVLSIDALSAIRVAEEPSPAIAPPPLLSMLTAFLTSEPVGIGTWAPESVTIWGVVGGVVVPPKLMPLLKGPPVQVVLVEPAVNVPPLATGVQLCATAGSDKPRDSGTRQEA